MGDGTQTIKSWFIGQYPLIPPFQGDYAGHSFRIGAATIAAMAAVEDLALAECCLPAVNWAALEQLAVISCQLATAGSSPVPLDSVGA